MARITMDNLGLTYLSLTVVWTVILIVGIWFLFVNRQSSFLRIRRLPLLFAALALLHVYFVLCMMSYIIESVVPCQVEYFVMSIYLPLGIAMFQTANSQFLYIATQQTIFTRMSSLDDPAVIERRRSRGSVKASGLASYLARYRRSDRITQMTFWIAVAMGLQVVLTIFIFLISEKFHPGFGIVPVYMETTVVEQRAACSRGWEWWGSILWQFFWSWIYAPWILFRSRSIKDTHGWRLQTILCCVSGLPASPLWLAGLYSEQMAVVDKVFPPPMWFAISVFLMQLFSVFIPCWSILAHRTLQQETLDALEAWQQRNKEFGSTDSDDATIVYTPTSSDSNSFKTLVALESNRKSACVRTAPKVTVLTMTALDHVLKFNPEPLQRFAALKDFAGENISFLTHLNDWKQSWKFSTNQDSSLPSEQHKIQAKKRRQQFNKAIRIYAAFVSLRYAEFPVNLSARPLQLLEQLLDRPAAVLYGGTEKTAETEIAPFAHPDESDKATLVSMAELGRDDLVWYWGPVPTEFDEHVFDESEKEIRYLVLTNTWPRFVNDEVRVEGDFLARVGRHLRLWK